jgi:alpha-D-ribose 1-methylphosphonate 5-triphosphate synthase subunit PhnG
MSEHQSLIMAMDRESLAEFRDLLGEEDIRVIRSPQTGLLMMAAKDPFDTDFCLGEILITEAETEYNGCRGYAMVLGDEPEKALLTAAVSAILQSDDGALKTRIGQFFAPLASDWSREAERERQLLAKTLVNFETMVKG